LTPASLKELQNLELSLVPDGNTTPSTVYQSIPDVSR
jgi:hypothetical protein